MALTIKIVRCQKEFTCKCHSAVHIDMIYVQTLKWFNELGYSKVDEKMCQNCGEILVRTTSKRIVNRTNPFYIKIMKYASRIEEIIESKCR